MSEPSPAHEAESLERRNRELSILNTMAQALNRSVSLDQALEAALSMAAELFNLQTGWIWLLDEETGGIRLAAAQNLPPALQNQPHLMQGSCYCLDSYMAGGLAGAANVNVITCTRLKDLVDGTDGLRYHASVPINAHGRQLGVLNVASADWSGITTDDLRLLYTIGDMLSIAIERARLFTRSAEIGAIEERNRLAREIHDTLAQGLAGIALQLESAEALLEANGDLQRIRRAVSQALNLARTNLEEARRSVLDLRLPILQGLSLAQALEKLVESARRDHGLRLDFQVIGELQPLSARLETGFYRIAQEAISNIARHAGADRAVMTLTIGAQHVRLVIQDYGKGFEPNEIPPGRFGLIGISERARLMGGEFNLQSQPGQGTRIEISAAIQAPLVDF